MKRALNPLIAIGCMLPLLLCVCGCSEDEENTSEADISAAGMTLVPAGSYVIGYEGAANHQSDEEPSVAVTVTAYYIDSLEVSNARFAAVANWAWREGYVQFAEEDGWLLADSQCCIWLEHESCRLEWQDSLQIIDGSGDLPLVCVTWGGRGQLL